MYNQAGRSMFFISSFSSNICYRNGKLNSTTMKELSDKRQWEKGVKAIQA